MSVTPKLDWLDVLSTKVRPFCLDTLRDIIEKQSLIKIAMDDDVYDAFDSLAFPASRGGPWLIENLNFEYIYYQNCIIYPEPTLTVLKELTGLSIIVGIRVDNSIYTEGLILMPKEKIPGG